MGKSNYEITKERMQGEFLKYDQRRMIDKYHLEHDEEYLYLRFAGRPYRVSRSSGIVEWSGDGFVTNVPGGFNEAMTIYDVLCYAREDCHLSGKFCKINHLRAVKYAAAPGTGLFQEYGRFFDGDIPGLHRACRALGGTPEGVGDVSYRLPVFDFLPMILQFWASDEEFPANLQMMWDENVLDYIHYETIFYAAGHVFARLQEEMGGVDVPRR